MSAPTTRSISRGSITFSNYKRIEAEYRAPRLFDRRGVLSVIGGWREATQVGFFGLGTPNTSQDDQVNYGFQQPYAIARLDVKPTRKYLLLGTGVEYSTWNTQSGAGNVPSIEEVYTPETLTGLGASPTYLQVFGTAAIDWRDAAGYSRRGGYYGVTARNYADSDDVYSFRQVDYEAIQHIPILRDAWVLSLRGRVETTYTDDGVEMPFFMLPSLGGGSTLRGFASWRFRDRHSLLLSAEWRVLVNRFIDTAIFYDAGKVTRSISDLDLDGLKKDYGIGFRLHGPVATPLRIDFAKSNEGLRIVFFGEFRRFETVPCTPLFDALRAAGVVTLLVVAGAISAVDGRAQVLSRRPDRARARDAGRLRRRAVGHRPVLRPRVQPVRHRTASARRRARAEHQHDRRGARLELVHQPDRHPRDDRGRGRARAGDWARRPTRRSGR